MMRWTLLVVPLLAVGCGPPALVAVTGRVLYDGKPAPGTVVYFWPADMSKQRFNRRQAIGVAGADGRFVLKCGAGEEGVEPGSYKVTFSRAVAAGKVVGDPAKKAEESGSVESVPQRLTDPSSTPRTAEVSAGSHEFAFDIPPK